VRNTVFVNGRFQFGEVVHRGLLYHVYLVFVLIGAGFEVGAIGVEHTTADKSVGNGLFNNSVEDGLFNPGLGKASAAVLGEGGGVDDFVGQA